MTSARNTDQTTAENMSGEVYEILVSRCDDEDFEGDWRYSAFCPDIDTAMDGRTPEEAILRVKDAMRVKLADYQADQISVLSPEARAEAVADFLIDGRLVDKTKVLLERE